VKRVPRPDGVEEKREGLLTRRSILVGVTALGGGLLGLQYRPQRGRLRPPTLPTRTRRTSMRGAAPAPYA
jgi:hypothetical protein